MASQLQVLLQTMSDNVQAIEAGCAMRGVSYPIPDILCSPESDAIQNEFAAESAKAVAAAYQLIATLSHPHPHILSMGLWGYFSAALAVVENGLVPDILREAGLKGVHISDISSINNLDPVKIGRCMRLLATRHIFEEVSPDVFRNTRLSSALCINKSVKEMLQNPTNRWDGTDGIAAMTALDGDELLKVCAHLVDNVTDPSTSFSQEPTESASQLALKTKEPLFRWMARPENSVTMKKFQNGMRATADYSSDVYVNQGFEWAALPEGSIVVDVAGGVGGVTMALAGTHKHLRYVVQDLPPVTQEANKLWSSKMPECINSGLVRLQAQDMFECQPVKDASVFIMRYITHNWSDKYNVKFLSRLREAATPTTKLLLLDHIQDYLCRHADVVANVPGAEKPAAPEPLLPYPDSVTGFTYLVDMHMMGMVNAQERTLGQFIELLKQAGWKLDRVNRFASPLPQQLICSPI